jgi:hypothetical protein
MQRTDVVFTPQSNSGVVGEAAAGVSTHSKFSSEILLLILRTAEQFCKTKSKRVGIWTFNGGELSERAPGSRLPLHLEVSSTYDSTPST